MVIVKRLGHAVEVSCCGQHDKHVENLMRMAPDVECARVASLRPASLSIYAKVSNLYEIHEEGKTNRIEKCTKNVHEPVQYDPAETHPVLERLVAELEQPVADGDDAGQAEADEHEGAVGPPGGRAEFLDPGDDDASYAQETYLFS